MVKGMSSTLQETTMLINCVAQNQLTTHTILAALAVWLLLPAGWSAVRARRAHGEHGEHGAHGAHEPAMHATAAPPGARGSRAGRVVFALALALVLLLTCDRIVRSSVYLVSIADEAVIWAAKAKALFVNDGLGGDLAARPWTDARVMHADYPLLSPLLQCWVYALAGGIVHAVNRLPLQLFLPALAFAMAGALRLRARPTLAAAFLLLLMTGAPLADLAARAQSDVMVALGFAVALDAFARFRRTGSARWWRLCVVALALLAWSKNEGLMLALALALPAALSLRRGSALPAVRRPRPAELAWLVLPAGLVGAQWAVNASHGFANDLIDGGLLSSAWPAVVADLPARAGTLLRHLVALTLRDADGSHLLLPMFTGLVVLFPRRLLLRCESVTAFAVLLGFAGYVLVYLGTPRDLDWHLATSLPRILFHLTPAAVMWTAAASEELLSPPARGAGRRIVHGLQEDRA
jgi:hypothetical protein